MPSFDFGDIDLTQNSTFDLSATVTATCSGTPNQRIRWCANIGSGTSGANGTGDPRYMLNGSDQLNFNIFQDSGYSSVWGSVFWVGSPPVFQLRLNNSGFQTSNQTVRVRIYAGQTSLPAGTYTTSFSGGHTLFAYQYRTSGSQDCNDIGASNGVQVPFTVQARNTGTCSVNATNLAFGNIGTLNTNHDETSTITVNCTSGAAYTVGLNGGLTGAADPTHRKMANGPDQITYGLYQDASRSTPWGNTTGVNTVSGSGSGANQSLTVYGRIAAQATPPAASYLDTIVVTVTY